MFMYIQSYKYTVYCWQDCSASLSLSYIFIANESLANEVYEILSLIR